LDLVNANKPAKVLDSKSLALSIQGQTLWPVYLGKPTRGNVRAARTYGVTADVPVRLVLAAKAMIVIVLTDQMP
jgi:hypothetical protein